MWAATIGQIGTSEAIFHPHWAMHFRGGSTTHLAIMLLTALCGGAVVTLGRHFKGTSLERAWNRAMRTGWIIIWLAWEGRNLLPSHLCLRTSLPLYVCNIVAVAIFLSLWTRWRVAQTLVVLVGIFLCSQALFTPPPMPGPASISFWIFFASHGAIITMGFYEVLVHDYRPNWRDWRVATFVTLAYSAVVFPVNTLLSANYGYLGQWESRAWVVADALGPWPWRVIWLVALAIFVMAVPVAAIQTWRWYKATAVPMLRRVLAGGQAKLAAA